MPKAVTSQKHLPVERAIPLEDAEVKAQQAIHDLNLRAHLENYSDSTPTAWRCSLLTPDGLVLASGAGKGNSTEARVGAMFEALEHLLTDSTYLDIKEIEFSQAREFASSDLSCEASMAIVTREVNQKLACFRYKSLTSDTEINAPLYLSSPWYVEDSSQDLRKSLGDNFDYREVARYSSNSGCAIGATKNEATVHALNEVIERDAFSLLLIRSFFGEGSSPKLINPESLPKKEAKLLSSVETLLQKHIYLLDITTDVNVPAFLAYAPPTGKTAVQYGSGASLSPSYAVYRALSELLQNHLLKAQHPDFDPRARLEALHKYPILYQCGQFDLTELLPFAKFVDFKECPVPSEPELHLAELAERLSAVGLSAYQRSMHSLDSGVTAVHVLVPGMERFLVVKEGLVVAPGERAIALVE